MKILDIPQSGKRGLNVSQAGQFGQISRALAIPANPRTASQMAVRGILSKVAAGWRALQEAQRAAWMAAAKEAKSTSRLGQNGTLSGFLLFTKINCTLAQFGQDQVEAPPAHPQFDDLAPQESGYHQQQWRGRAEADLPDQSRHRTPLCAAPRRSARAARPMAASGSWACVRPRRRVPPTSRAYTPPGMACRRSAQKVFVRVNQFVDGWEDLPVTFSAIVPGCRLTFRRGARAVEQSPAPGFQAGRRPFRAPARSFHAALDHRLRPAGRSDHRQPRKVSWC